MTGRTAGLIIGVAVVTVLVLRIALFMIAPGGLCELVRQPDIAIGAAPSLTTGLACGQ